MKKFSLLIMVCFICTIVNAQAFLGFGAGVHNFKSPVISLYTGYQLKHVVSEFELKAPPVDMHVSEPATMSFKTGYEITLAGHLVFIPQIEASYMQYSTDETKGATWQNGWKTGVGARLRWKNVFAQADYAGTTYLCVGICAQLKRQQSW
ncbi:MAG TPA: hypothetical protein VG738_09040 [Chitinophagaceae bacterium]|nr:hypothetical protein [Chitinophagaceae bacterium]